MTEPRKPRSRLSRRFNRRLSRRLSRHHLLKDYMTRETLKKELGIVSDRTITRYEGDRDNPLPWTEIGGRKEYHRPLVEEWLARRGKRRNPRHKTNPKPRQPPKNLKR